MGVGAGKGSGVGVDVGAVGVGVGDGIFPPVFAEAIVDLCVPRELFRGRLVYGTNAAVREQFVFFLWEGSRTQTPKKHLT